MNLNGASSDPELLDAVRRLEAPPEGRPARGWGPTV